MWKNMTWLAEEWRYYFEWRKLALASRLEGKDVPPRNSPFWYTFRWFGVAVALPVTVTGIVGVLGYAVSTSEQAMHVALGVSLVLAVAGWIIYIIYSMVAMGDNGPSHAVVSKWMKDQSKTGETGGSS